MKETLSDHIHMPSDFLAMSDDLHEFILTEHVKKSLKDFEDDIANTIYVQEFPITPTQIFAILERHMGDALLVNDEVKG